MAGNTISVTDGDQTPVAPMEEGDYLLGLRGKSTRRFSVDQIAPGDGSVSPEKLSPTLISDLAPASGSPSYATLVPVAEDGGGNGRRPVQALVGAGGCLPFATLEDAREADVLPTISRVTILDAADADGGPGHIRVRVDAEPAAGPKHRSADGGWWALSPKSIAAGSLVPVPEEDDAGKELIPKGMGAYIMVPPRRIRLTEYGATGEVNREVDTAAWAAALAEVDANVRGKVIELPTCKPGPNGGTYLGVSLQLTTPSRNKTTLIGSGFAGAQSSTYSGGSRVVTDLSAGFVFVIGSTLTPLTHFNLLNFTIDNQGGANSGANILVNNSAENDIYVEHRGGFHGVQIENAGNQAVCRLWDSIYHDLSGVSMALGLVQPYFANGVSAGGGGSYRCKSAALFRRASGVQITGHESYLPTSHAWDFEPDGIGIQGVWLTKTYGDSANGDAYRFGGSGKCAEIHLVAPQASSCAGKGISTSSTVQLNGLTVLGGIMSNDDIDLDFQGGKNIKVEALQAWYAATATLRLGPTMTGGVVVEGCQFGTGGWFEASGVPARTPYCALIAAGADNYFVTRNTMRGATIAAISDGNGPSTTRVTSGNYIY